MTLDDDARSVRNDDGAATATRTAVRRRRILGWVLAIAMVAPPVIVIAMKAGRTFHPVDDIAIIDLRVRDVWSAHPSLTGLFSRPGWNHPGPALFWLIALVSGPFGEPAWATRVGGALIDAVAMGWLAWITWRAGLRMMLSAAAVVGMTYLAISVLVIREPWNLNIPLMALPLVLFLALVVANGSSRHLIGLAIVATIIVQTHVGFALPVVTAVVFALVCLGLDARAAGRLPDRWRSTVAITSGALVVLWSPPMFDVLVNWPGNLGKIVKYFAAGTYNHVGLSEATGIVAAEFRFLPPWLGGGTKLGLFTAFAEPASRAWLLIPVVILALGAAAAWRSGRNGDRRMVALAIGLFGVAIFAISRADEPRAYTFEWRVVIATFIVVAGVQAVASWVSPRRAATTLGTVLVVGIALWGAVDLALRINDVEPTPLETRAAALAAVLPTIRATPDARRVLVRPSGSTLRSLFDGVINELDRARVDVRVDPELGRIFGNQRRGTPDQVDEIWYVTEDGSTVPALLRQPGAHVLASTSPLSPAENRELDRIQATLRTQLLRARRPDAVRYLDQPLFALIVRDIPGVNPVLAARASVLNQRVSRRDGCRCTIVAVPAR